MRNVPRRDIPFGVGDGCGMQRSRSGSSFPGVGDGGMPRSQSSFLEEPARMCSARAPSGVEVPVEVTTRSRRATACAEHPHELAVYFCTSCECACICAECVVHGRHRGHDVLKASRAHETLMSRAGTLLEEASSLEDDLTAVADQLDWRRKDVERVASRGRANVRSAFARVRAQLDNREAELLQSLDLYESENTSMLTAGTSEQDDRLTELRRVQEDLRTQCRAGVAVDALNSYASAKTVIASIRDLSQQTDYEVLPREFVGLAGSARAALDLHTEGLSCLEEAVADLCYPRDKMSRQ